MTGRNSSMLDAAKDAVRLLPLLPGCVTSRFRRANVMMLHFGRCGSTVVGNMLRQHPDIHWDAEVLQYRKEFLLPECRLTTDPKRIMRLRMLRCGRMNYGMEIKPLSFMHLSSEQLDMSLEQFFALLREMQFTHLVFLERRHYLRQLVSLTVAVEKSVYESAPGEQRRKVNTVRIDCDKTAFGDKPILELFHDYDAVTREIMDRGRRDDMPFLDLNYGEHILPDPGIAFGRVCDFIGIPRRDVARRNQRVNPAPLPEIVTNWDEVCQTLSGTPYEWMTERDEHDEVAAT